ncbi:MAG TPA: DUF2203 domain-containing protein [Pyrinomonadaceae bacterium]|nr:DUF2203 domain-containing protein [Pyrinomonadaceae bacterium]
MKLFSVEEANALLPTARRIVERVRRAYRRVLSLREQAKRAAEGAEQGGGGFAPGSHAYVEALTELVERAGELDALGVQLKDYGRGLIDFPCMREGRVVLLCWQLGEDERIEWWHETDTGFAGRQRL